MMTDKTTLRVGLDDAPPSPIQIGGPETGDFQGFEADLLNELGKRLGVGLQYRRSFWSEIVRELAAGELDIICSAATVTEERKLDADFCTPHLRLSLAVVKRADSPEGKELRGLRVGVRRGTTAEGYVEGRGVAPAAVSESNEELYEALAGGELDAVVDDSPVARYFADLKPGLRYMGPLEGTEGAYAIMVQKGNRELRGRINEALASMDMEGFLREIRGRWLKEN
jgi:polar amino acid transport system substrate-binding protein